MRKKILITISITTILCGYYFFSENTKAATGEIRLEITPLHLTIGTTGTITLSQITYSGSAQTILGTISPNILQVEDKKAHCSGYYTTIQAGHLQYNSNTISNTNISLSGNSIATKIAGIENNDITIGNGLNNKRGTIASPMTYFQRKNNQGCRIIGKYGDTPSLQINIPANQTTGDYRGKLYYILYDNN